MCVCAVESVGDVLTTQLSLVKLGPKKRQLGGCQNLCSVHDEDRIWITITLFRTLYM